MSNPRPTPWEAAQANFRANFQQLSRILCTGPGTGDTQPVWGFLSLLSPLLIFEDFPLVLREVGAGNDSTDTGYADGIRADFAAFAIGHTDGRALGG